MVHPQLQAVIGDFEAAQARLHRLAQTAPESAWTQRPDPARWSMAECVAHLNLTSEAYLPLLRAALDRSAGIDGRAPRRYRAAPLSKLLAEFDRLQALQLKCVGDADGLALERIWIRSPFDQRVRYNAYSCLTILPRHQHRHLWQAEQVWSAISA